MKSEVKLRVSVLGLFVDGDNVLMIHQMTPPEPNCWDLPGGGLEPSESIFEGLSREVQEETGIRTFQVEQLLTVAESFWEKAEGKLLHTINLIYQCTVEPKPVILHGDPLEVGPKGIQWLPVSTLTPEICSSRSWQALQAAGLV